MNQNYENANVSVAGTKAQVNKNDVVDTKSQNLMVLVEKAVRRGGINSAIEMLMSKALNDDPEAVYYLSKLYMNEEVVKGEYETGWHFLMWSAAHGVINAIVDVAAIALRSVETSEDAKVAFSWIHEAAYLGHPECESILSSFYAAGFGCKRNMKLAHMWMLKAQIDNFNKELALQILGANEKVNKLKDKDYEKEQ